MIKEGTKRRVYAKYKLIEYKGGKCLKCGYDKVYFTRAFTFHHRNPEEKEFEICRSYRTYDEMKKEVDKCDLLCVRCHMEIHDEPFAKQREVAIQEIEKNQKEISEKPHKDCLNCKKQYSTNVINSRYCCKECKYKFLSDNPSPNRFRLSILELDMEGNLKKEWDSITDAAKFYNTRHTTLIKCLKGQSKSAHNSLWQYKDVDRRITGVGEGVKYAPNHKWKYNDEMVYYIKYVPEYKYGTVVKLAKIFKSSRSYLRLIKEPEYRPDITEDKFNKEEIKQKINKEFNIAD